MSSKRLQLDRFVPYRLSVVTNQVSTAIARQYSEQFDLTIPEWRVMAVLGEASGISAREVAERTAMDKVQVSRAVASLIKANRVARTTDHRDSRIGRLELTRRGRAVYDRIVPLALGLEEQLLAALSQAERGALTRVLAKLSQQTHTLTK